MYQRILVPFDGSPVSLHGLDEAIAMAKLTGARLRILHVLDEWIYASGFETCAVYSTDVVSYMREAGNEVLATGRSRAEAAGAGIAVDVKLAETCGRRIHEVVAEEVAQWRADLVVIGTHGRRGVSRVMLGSDAEQIVRTSTVPVLVVRLQPVVADVKVPLVTPALPMLV